MPPAGLTRGLLSLIDSTVLCYRYTVLVSRTPVAALPRNATAKENDVDSRRLHVQNDADSMCVHLENDADGLRLQRGLGLALLTTERFGELRVGVGVNRVNLDVLAKIGLCFLPPTHVHQQDGAVVP